MPTVRLSPGQSGEPGFAARRRGGGAGIAPVENEVIEGSASNSRVPWAPSIRSAGCAATLDFPAGAGFIPFAARAGAATGALAPDGAFVAARDLACGARDFARAGAFFAGAF